MPPRVDVQADNAHDNKCWAMLLFLALLVYHGYTREVFFSFLLVVHTHEDIDQVFSIISSFFRKLPVTEAKTPSSFAKEMLAAVDERFTTVSEQMLCVLDCTTTPRTPSLSLTPAPEHTVTGTVHHARVLSRDESTGKDTEPLTGRNLPPPVA